MLRIIQNSASASAKSYYSTADYYSEGQELAGVWRGLAAERLGLSGEVGHEHWAALCDNRDPESGARLTARQRLDRRVGYDFNFHVPKSVSLLYGLTQDERILDAFREAVDATMQDMEAEMQTRVRAGGRDEDRTTGNMVWGEFVHLTARPVGGVPDPHLHAHCFVFNTTWDQDEGRWKAGQFVGLKKDAPFFEAVFHSRLARGLEDLGLSVERSRSGWEVEGISKVMRDKFSRRTVQIEEKAAEKGVTDPAKKGELGAKTRNRKQSEMGLEELRELWTARLTDDERDAVTRAADQLGRDSVSEDEGRAREAVAAAISHCFERCSVVPERTLMTVALKRLVGVASPELVKEMISAEPLLRAKRGGEACVTTAEVLEEERRMVAFAREGRGTRSPIAPGDHVFSRDWLNTGQRQAVAHVLGSRDGVVVIRGAAGTGKTSMMQEAAEAIETAGKRVFVFAPSAEASRGVLRSEGFATADTVARLLLDEKLQEQARGQVLWVDEAGLLSSRAMASLFELAERIDARVVLSGDRRQHGSVERGAALRLLETDAGLVPAEIKDIQRQKADYKRAVAALSEGRTNEGFRELDRLGWVREVEAGKRYQTLADDYLATVGAGKTALVVSPTHLEGEWITDAIRGQMKDRGRLGRHERVFSTLEGKNLTEAERGDITNYGFGDVLVFHQNAKGVARGERVAVTTEPLPLSEATKFQLYRRSSLAVAPGDLVRITRNGSTADGAHRLNNGAVYTVERFDPNGNLVLSNGWTVAKDFGFLTHGYCVTSHASQGRTVDRVLIGQSSDSARAASSEQFYVSVSRGRERATIYTDDKRALVEAVGRTDDRMTATELLRQRSATVQRQAEFERHLSPQRKEQQRDLEPSRG